MRIIPAIDLIDGKCVRLSKGDYSTKKVYSENPLELAKAFEDSGITHLHLVDLDGAKQKKLVNHKVLEQIAKHSHLQIDYSGGIRSTADVEIAFGSGAAQISCGSIALQDPELFMQWLANYGRQKIILGADAHKRKVATHGWLQLSETDIVDYINTYLSKGLEYVICTDIEKDGMLEGALTSYMRKY